jgi:hypothetical protein
MKLSNKITIGGINNVRKGFKNLTERELMMRVVGIARSYEEKVSETMGISCKFNGEFRAFNREGVEYVSPTLYIPEPAQGLLRAALDGETVTGIEFGFNFFAIPDETSLVGYIWETVSLIESKPSTALEKLMKSLPAPKDEKGEIERAKGFHQSEPENKKEETIKTEKPIKK